MPPLKETIVRFLSGTLAAGAIQVFEMYGDYVFLLSNTGAANTLGISFDNTGFQKMPVGLVLHANQAYTRVILQNNDSVSSTFSILAGQGQLDYKALVISSSISTSPSQAIAGTFAADVATGASAKIYTFVSTNKSVFVQADFLNSDQVYIGFDITVSATKKFIALSPGMSYEFTNLNCDIWAFSAAAQNIAVSSW